MVGSIAVVSEQYAGAVSEPVQLANTVLAAALESENDKAGVLVGVATEVVKSGDKFPELKVVTVPDPPGLPKAHAEPVH
jgi:hypothetical protein